MSFSYVCDLPIFKYTNHLDNFLKETVAVVIQVIKIIYAIVFRVIININILNQFIKWSMEW